MAKKKLRRFAENLTFPNMFQLNFEQLKEGFHYKGQWNEYFGNDHPVMLELGCGKGEYTIYLAQKNPGRNYIGMDIKGARMWKGCKSSNEQGMKNVAFIRSHVQVLEQFFGPGEVSGIWITFPDPQPRQSREKRRLTAPRFLEIYARVLKPGSLIHLKTDNQDLFNYTLGVVREGGHKLIFSTHDLYASGGPEDAAAIRTFYEQMWLAEGKSICYLEFSL